MEPAVLYGSAVAASFVVLLTVTLLFFSRRTVSFEEAVLQPRQHQAVVKPKKADARKEKKNDKKKTGKKVDEDEVDKQAAPVLTVTPEPHVEFRVANEVVPLDEEHEQQLAKRQVHGDERPKKPILTKRNEQPDQTATDTRTQIGRCNSFETVHPKDEYELIKSQQTRDQKPGSSDDDVRSEKTKVRDGKKKSAKSAKASPADKLTVAQLLDMVKSVALSEEESQLVVNEILNKESESTWSQKNDPLALLKKNLQEKEAQLRTEAENREALKVRLTELRQELAAQKTQSQTVRTQCQQLQQELLKSQTGLRAAVEQHRNELQTLQTKVRNECSAKAAASLSRLQDENNRLKDLVQKLEVDRSALDAIPRLQKEMEQLRGDRQQKELTIAHLKQQNEDLMRETAGLTEQLKILSSGRQQDDFAAKQQIADLQAAVRDRESAAQSVAEELRLARDRLLHVTRDLEQLQKHQSDVSAESCRLSDETDSLKSLLAESEKQAQTLRLRLQHAEQEASDVRSRFENETAAMAAKVHTLEEECGEWKQRVGAGSDQAVRDAEQRADLLAQEKRVLSDELSDQKTLVSDLQQEKDSLLQSLSSSFTHLNVGQQNLPQAVDTVVRDLRTVAEERAAAESLVRQQLDEQRSLNQMLQREVATYTLSLKQTDESLKEIESRAEAQEKRWRAELEAEREQAQRMAQENAGLAGENQSLKQTIKELQSIQTTVVDMEDKLRDLQSKLRGEEVAKLDLSGKFDEVSSADVREAASRALTMKEELDRTTKQLLDLRQERLDADELQKQVDELQQQLEREKKSAKETQAQNVKLRSLVKIGEDSLRAEMQRTDELLNQLKLRNGSAVSTPCLTTNGNDQDSVPSSVSSSSLNREGSNGN